MSKRDEIATETANPAAPRRRLGRWIALAVLIMAVAALMHACRGEKTYDWEEEVVLSSGERLLLDRTVRVERTSAAFNPLKFEWALRESTITVREGPADLKGARYESTLLPMLIERETGSKRLLIVAISGDCFEREALKAAPGQRYFAFELRSDRSMAQVRVPDWAWERRLNLLMPNEDKPPPRRVTPEFADRFNREESRGEKHYFVIDRSIKSNC